MYILQYVKGSLMKQVTCKTVPTNKNVFIKL